MSPETNGNPPPITKRKKNRDKPLTNSQKLNDLSPPMYNNFLNNISSYPNVSSSESSYQPFLNYSVPTEPMSLPVYPSSYQNFHVPYNSSMNYGTMPNNPMSMPYFMRMNMGSNEYMSLPIGTLDQNDNSDKRRYSDPGLPNESDSSTNSIEGRIIHKLTQQINSLKENNRHLTREITEMRMEINMLKQQQAQRNLEREYEPGMLADVIREVRDAARVREDALLARVKHMIEEKQLSMVPIARMALESHQICHLHYTICPENLKQDNPNPMFYPTEKLCFNQLHLVTEKNRNSERLTKLEDQLKNLSIVHNRTEDNISSPSSASAEEHTGSARQVLELEREALQLRRELQEARAKKEESDQKLLQLDKKLVSLLRRKDTTASEMSEDGKTSTSGDTSFSISTPSTGPLQTTQRITLSGPVTDL